VLRKLSEEKMQILLQDLYSFLDELPGHMDETREVRQRLAASAELLEGAEGATSTGVADELGDWLVGYFQLVSSPTATPFIPTKLMC